jgi:hypothetical protein
MNQNEEVQVIENVIYGYTDNKGQMVYTPNLEFAKIMAYKYETYNVTEVKQ